MRPALLALLLGLAGCAPGGIPAGSSPAPPPAPRTAAQAEEAARQLREAEARALVARKVAVAQAAAADCVSTVIDNRDCIVCETTIAFRSLTGTFGENGPYAHDFTNYSFVVRSPTCDFSKPASAKAPTP